MKLVRAAIETYNRHTVPTRLQTLLPFTALWAMYTLILQGAYRSGYFAYHDLGLISGFFQNAVHRGLPFWVSDGGFNHFSVHFTPSLALLIPLYWISDGATTFLTLAAAALAWAGSQLYSETIRLRPTLGNGWWVLWLILITSNLWKSALMSAHFEVFQIPLALFTLRLVADGSRWLRVLPVLLLTLGIRQDIGLYLGCALFAVGLVLPPRRTKAAVYGLICFAYLPVCVLWIMPYFGGGQDPRNWAEWGSTWPQVAWGIASHPVRLAFRLAQADWHYLVLAGAATMIFRPLAALLVLSPGLFAFAAESEAQLRLWYYAGTFFLAGLLWVSIRSVPIIAKLLGTRQTTLILSIGLLISLARITQVQGPLPRFKFYFDNHDAFQTAQAAFTALPAAAQGKMASSHHLAVFVPGRFEILSLTHLDQAQYLAVDTREDPLPKLPGWQLLPATDPQARVRILVKNL